MLIIFFCKTNLLNPKYLKLSYKIVLILIFYNNSRPLIESKINIKFCKIKWKAIV